MNLASSPSLAQPVAMAQSGQYDQSSPLANVWLWLILIPLHPLQTHLHTQSYRPQHYSQLKAGNEHRYLAISRDHAAQYTIDIHTYHHP